VLNIEAKTFELQEVKGNERKTSGTYYTPPSLVHCLLDSALEPIIQDAHTKPNVEQALLDLKICDPACGSGHFMEEIHDDTVQNYYRKQAYYAKALVPHSK